MLPVNAGSTFDPIYDLPTVFVRPFPRSCIRQYFELGVSCKCHLSLPANDARGTPGKSELSDTNKIIVQ